MRLHNRSGGATRGARAAFVLCVAIVSPMGVSRLHAQTPPATAPDPGYEIARKAFDALPDGDRRNIQDSLIWTGDYKGGVDGNFGRGTRAAIAAFAARARLPADGTLDDKGRTALFAAGAAAKQAAGFTTVADMRSGTALGVPLRWMPQKTTVPGGSRWASADGALALDTTQMPESAGDLASLFARLTADQPGRKVTYKVLRPDFLVVSGEAAGALFYTRIVRGVPGAMPLLRGFTLRWPSGRKDLDAASIAVANAFQPFPSPLAPPPTATTAVAAAPVPSPASAASAPPPVPAQAVAQPPRLAFAGSVVAVTPSVFAGSLGAAKCTDPQIGGAKARLLSTDAASGLALFEATGGKPIPATLATPAVGDPLVIVFLAPKGGSGAPQLLAAGAPVATEVMVAAGEWQQAGTPPRILAPIQGNPGGALVFDRAGGFAGIVAATDAAPRLVAGVLPQSTYKVITAATLSSLAGLKAAGTAEAGAAAIAGRAGPALAALQCAR